MHGLSFAAHPVFLIARATQLVCYGVSTEGLNGIKKRRRRRHTPQAGSVAAEQLKAQASTRMLDDLMMRPFGVRNCNDRQVESERMRGV
jgi:hypothetical protein